MRVLSAAEMHCAAWTGSSRLDCNRLSHFVFLPVRSKFKFQFHEAIIWTRWIFSGEAVFLFKAIVVHWNRRCP